ncbi:MAG: FtsW/RodA/SpoVE family cell cycle protein [Bacteroidales bacterium]|nr:FtsW/RodA/SpoVE family cell cycle protein [Bacteroidales bacterium]
MARTARKKKSIWNLTEGFKGDKIILMVALLLMLISIIAVFSSTTLLANQGGDRVSIVRDQLVAVAIGLGIMAFCYFVIKKTGVYRFFSQFGFLVAFALLAILMFHIKNPIFKFPQKAVAHRILLLGGMQIHVFEIVKVVMVMYIAWAVSSFKEKRFTFFTKFAEQNPSFSFVGTDWFLETFYIFIPMAATTGLVIMGSNSAAILIAGVMLLLCILGGIKFKHILVYLAVLVVGAGLLVTALAFTDKGRGATLKSRIHNSDEANLEQLYETRPGTTAFYKAMDKLKQPISAEYAIKEGGIFGKFIGGSTQKYVTAAIYEDYMYSFIVEETGLVGGLLIIMLYLSLLARGVMIVKDCGDNLFAKLSVAGLILMICSQAMLHMAVNVHLPLVPQTGQTLPMISHGSSAFIMFCLAFGIILSISRNVWVKMQKREADAAPIIEHSDPVQAGLDDLEQLETLNEDNGE